MNTAKCIFIAERRSRVLGRLCGGKTDILYPQDAILVSPVCYNYATFRDETCLKVVFDC